jgi:hypothetical protein
VSWKVCTRKYHFLLICQMVWLTHSKQILVLNKGVSLAYSFFFVH